MKMLEVLESDWAFKACLETCLLGCFFFCIFRCRYSFLGSSPHPHFLSDAIVCALCSLLTQVQHPSVVLHRNLRKDCLRLCLFDVAYLWALWSALNPYIVIDRPPDPQYGYWLVIICLVLAFRRSRNEETPGIFDFKATY